MKFINYSPVFMIRVEITNNIMKTQSTVHVPYPENPDGQKTACFLKLQYTCTSTLIQKKIFHSYSTIVVFKIFGFSLLIFISLGFILSFSTKEPSLLC